MVVVVGIEPPPKKVLDRVVVVTTPPFLPIVLKVGSLRAKVLTRFSYVLTQAPYEFIDLKEKRIVSLSQRCRNIK